MTYPVAEIFHSIQGEGRWTGTPMMFVRLAGCNVGKYESADTPDLFKVLNGNDLQLFISKNHSVCTTIDGQRFLCDTDYHANAHITPEQIAAEIANEYHVCITGGEPLLHSLEPLLQALRAHKELSLIHIETSGTLPINLWGANHDTWITCCPKDAGKGLDKSIFEYADEWKVLVGSNFKESTLNQLEEVIPWSQDERFLQPINGVDDVWQENFDRCLDLLKRWPHWKLSAQLHKYLKVR